MKEFPILFSAPMIRAILDGRKVQTRRIMKPIPKFPDSYFKKRVEVVGDEALFYRPGAELPAYRFRCPFGQPGDHLWVRETWRPYSTWQGSSMGCSVEFRAGGLKTIHDDIHIVPNHKEPWRPSIHMPRWASRITLEVTAVRVELLQDITEEDAMAEGCEWTGEPGMYGDGCVSPLLNFEYLWQSLNAKRPSCSWDDNPWVWVVEFNNPHGKGTL